jgi:spore germination protein
MKDGRILGCEASDYYKYHDTARVSTTPTISASEAVDKVSANLDVTDVSLALIQTDGLDEVLCYEIKGNANDATYVVYIDAQTGAERRIDRVIDNAAGTSIF